MSPLVPLASTHGSSLGLAGATAPTRFVGATAFGPPLTGTFLLGDFVIDETGSVWVCTTAGSPGTWTQPFAADPLARAHGLKDWSFHPALASAGAVLTSQTVYAVTIPVVAGVAYTGLELSVLVSGAGVVPTGFQVGLASSAATGIMLAQSANLAASGSLTGIGVQRFAFSAPYTPAATALVYAVILENGAFATTPVQFGRLTTPAHTGIEGKFYAAVAGAASATLPANTVALPSAYAEAGAVPWFVGLY